jgi:hypothetical protein
MRIAFVLLVLLVVSACTSGARARVDPPNIAAYKVNYEACPVYRPPAPGLLVKLKSPERQRELRRFGAIPLDCFTFPDNDQPAYKLAVGTGNEAGRDRLINALMTHSDAICTVEKSIMLERQAEVNGWLSIFATGMSISSTIVTGELASNILAGGSALANASRDHVNTHVYRNTIIQTITKAIDTERAAMRTAIEAKFSRKNSDYSIDHGIRDVNEYHGMCSFGVGLQKVMEAVDRQEDLRKQLRVSVIESVLEDNGPAKVDETLRKKLVEERVKLLTDIQKD